jgi:hypothetical protein
LVKSRREANVTFMGKKILANSVLVEKLGKRQTGRPRRIVRAFACTGVDWVSVNCDGVQWLNPVNTITNYPVT